ncbi:MAG TPA: hypothetical protein VLM37_00760 [Fibrobacteraceae bacterium]|nr:hypothetical protein [Fibrobacteraceae bacterium]
MSAHLKAGIAYFGVRNPEWVRRDMERIVAAGFTHVLHTWSEEDLQYYAETMAAIVSLSQEVGLKVYVNPWGIGRVFGGEAYSELTAHDHSIAQVDSLGKSRVAACPNHPLFRAYIHRWIDSVCATPVETIFWDEPHFDFAKGEKGVWSCRCATCQRLFQQRFGATMPLEIDDQVRTFREDCLVGFLDEMTSRVAKYGKRNSVCMLPPWFPAGLDDWDRVASLPHVDEISSDPYWEKTTPPQSVAPTYAEVSTRLVDLAHRHGKEPQIWIKNYHIVSGTETCVVDATNTAFGAGIRNIFAWSYLGSSYLSWLRSDQPEKVWRLQCAALDQCRKTCGE